MSELLGQAYIEIKAIDKTSEGINSAKKSVESGVAEIEKKNYSKRQSIAADYYAHDLKAQFQHSERLKKLADDYNAHNLKAQFQHSERLKKVVQNEFKARTEAQANYAREAMAAADASNRLIGNKTAGSTFSSGLKKQMEEEANATKQSLKEQEAYWLKHYKTIEDLQTASMTKKEAALKKENDLYNQRIASVDKLKKSSSMSADELNKIEKGLAEQHKRTTKDIQAGNDNRAVSFKTATMNILKAAPAFAVATAAVGVFYAALNGIKDEFTSGLKVVEDYRVAVAGMAGFLVTFTGGVTKENMADVYSLATKEAEKLINQLEIIDARSIATGKELTSMSQQFIAGGIQLDLANKETADGFVNIANALKLLTKGQNQEIQMRQETRSLVQGTVKDSNVLMTTLKLIDPEIKKHLATWKEEGTTIKNVGVLLAGLGLATKDFENTWSVVGSTMSTIHTRILRDAFLPTYDRLIALAKSFNSSLMDANGELTPLAKNIIDITKATLNFAENLSKAAVEAAGLALVFGIITKNTMAIGAALTVGIAAGSVALEKFKLDIEKTSSESGEKMGGIPDLFITKVIDFFNNPSLFNGLGDIIGGVFEKGFLKGEELFIKFINFMKMELSSFLDSSSQGLSLLPFGEDIGNSIKVASDNIKNSITSIDSYKAKQEGLNTKIKNTVLSLFNFSSMIKDTAKNTDYAAEKNKKFIDSLVEKGIPRETALKLNQLTPEQSEEIAKFANEIGKLQQISNNYGKTREELAREEIKDSEILKELRKKGLEQQAQELENSYLEAARGVDNTNKKKESAKELNKTIKEQIKDYKSILDALEPARVAQEKYNEGIAALNSIDPSHSTERYKNGLEELNKTTPEAIEHQRQLNVQIDNFKTIVDEVVAAEETLRVATMSDSEKRIDSINKEYDAYEKTLDMLIKNGSTSVDSAEKIQEIRDKLNLREVEALDDLKNKNDDVSKKMEEAFKGWANNMSQDLNDVLWGADVTFGSIAESFAKMITQMVIQIQIIEPLLNSLFDKTGGSGGIWGTITSAIGGVLGSSSGSSISLTDYSMPSTTDFSGVGFNAKGNVFNTPSLSAYSNSIVDKPTFFAKGGNVMGEKGPEAIIPLERTSDGRLGISSSGGKSGNVTVNIINNTNGSKATTNERTDNQGNRIIDVMIDQIKSSIAGDISRGDGAVPNALNSTYGLNRVAGAY